MINFRKWIGLTASISCLLVVATNFQNCAGQGPMATGASQSGYSNNDGTATIIDDATTTTALNFREKAIQVGEAEEAVVAQGVCFREQEGAVLAWELLSEDNLILETGFADCQSGSFEVAINDLQGLECGEYMIQARLGLGQAGQVSLSIACE